MAGNAQVAGQAAAPPGAGFQFTAAFNALDDGDTMSVDATSLLVKATAFAQWDVANGEASLPAAQLQGLLLPPCCLSLAPADGAARQAANLVETSLEPAALSRIAAKLGALNMYIRVGSDKIRTNADSAISSYAGRKLEKAQPYP